MIGSALQQNGGHTIGFIAQGNGLFFVRVCKIVRAVTKPFGFPQYRQELRRKYCESKQRESSHRRSANLGVPSLLLGNFGSLFAECGARRLRQMSDRSFPFCRACSLANIFSGCSALLCAGHWISSCWMGGSAASADFGTTRFIVCRQHKANRFELYGQSVEQSVEKKGMASGNY